MKPQVTESMIDQVLERLFSINTSAARAVLDAVMPSLNAPLFDRVDVRRQVPHIGTSGSADLVLHFLLHGTPVALVLLENKIDAGFTLDQPLRYALCRDAHLKQCSAPVVFSLLISPEVYIQGSRLTDQFDAALTYEALLTFTGGTDRVLLETAIERASSPYEPVPDEAVMDFFDGYTRIASEICPDLRIKSNPNSGNARPKASRTIYFDAKASGFRRYPFLLKGDSPASMRVSHQCWDSSAPSASVKLMVDGWAKHLAAAAPILNPPLAGSGIYIRSAGRSLALVSDTPRLDNRQSALAQRMAIEQALLKIVQIREVWNRMESNLNNLAQDI